MRLLVVRYSNHCITVFLFRSDTLNLLDEFYIKLYGGGTTAELDQRN